MVFGTRSWRLAALVAAVLLLASCSAFEEATGLNQEQAAAPSGEGAAEVIDEDADDGTDGGAGADAGDAPDADAVAALSGASSMQERLPDDAGDADDVRSGANADDQTDGGTETDSASGDDAGTDAEAEPADAGLVAVADDARGDAVEALQQRLDALGFAPGPVDGVYGPQTAAAVEAFQLLNDLEQTGRADTRTVAAIEDYDGTVETLQSGDEGSAVEQLQRRLADGPFDPGPADGVYGGKTVEAVWALEKLAGIPVDGRWGPLDEHAYAQFEDGAIGGPAERHDQRWVEVDLSEQLMKVYDPGASSPHLVSHVSSGNGQSWCNEQHCGTSVTPTGEFHINRRIAGWRESSLDIGRLYNPLYFNGGIAFHGALSVPLYPASHGCVRVPMHIAEYLPDELPNGTPVHVLQ